jgi:hypothetical protein
VHFADYDLALLNVANAFERAFTQRGCFPQGDNYCRWATVGFSLEERNYFLIDTLTVTESLVTGQEFVLLTGHACPL